MVAGSVDSLYRRVLILATVYCRRADVPMAGLQTRQSDLPEMQIPESGPDVNGIC